MNHSVIKFSMPFFMRYCSHSSMLASLLSSRECASTARRAGVQAVAAYQQEPEEQNLGPLPDEVMLFVLEATKIDHHWSSLKQDGSVRRRILAPAVAASDFRSAATREHAEQIKEPLQSSNTHWVTVFYQLGGLDDLEQFLKWATERVFVRLHTCLPPCPLPASVDSCTVLLMRL
jgi:hypothetical protein